MAPTQSLRFSEGKVLYQSRRYGKVPLVHNLTATAKIVAVGREGGTKAKSIGEAEYQPCEITLEAKPTVVVVHNQTKLDDCFSSLLQVLQEEPLSAPMLGRYVFRLFCACRMAVPA